MELLYLPFSCRVSVSKLIAWHSYSVAEVQWKNIKFGHRNLNLLNFVSLLLFFPINKLKIRNLAEEFAIWMNFHSVQEPSKNKKLGIIIETGKFSFPSTVIWVKFRLFTPFFFLNGFDNW